MESQTTFKVGQYAVISGIGCGKIMALETISVFGKKCTMAKVLLLFSDTPSVQSIQTLHVPCDDWGIIYGLKVLSGEKNVRTDKSITAKILLQLVKSHNADFIRLCEKLGDIYPLGLNNRYENHSEFYDLAEEYIKILGSEMAAAFDVPFEAAKKLLQKVLKTKEAPRNTQALSRLLNEKAGAQK